MKEKNPPHRQSKKVGLPSRNITRSIESMLWGKAAGRCEFAGCNRLVRISAVTAEQVNISEKAHIYSFKANGPRGHVGIEVSDLNFLANLMLLCHDCHKLIDQKKDGGRYTVGILEKMKEEHEERIRLCTAFGPQLKSHVLLYGANVGEQSSPLRFSMAATALNGRYPADDVGISLGMVDSSYRDRDQNFWQIETQHLQMHFDKRIREHLAREKIDHLSVFAFAPQPLLILLGSLLSDIVAADIYQLHREPKQSWSWPSAFETQPLQVIPGKGTGIPALVLSLSDIIAHDRVTSVLGSDADIWTITVPHPQNDLIKSPQQLSEFRAVVRKVLADIGSIYGPKSILHIFPAFPIATSIDFGRVRMPKANMPWDIYDHNNATGGFIKALSIPL